MKITYKVNRQYNSKTYEVSRIETIEGKRLDAYSTEPDIETIFTRVFSGTICECESYIRLTEKGILDSNEIKHVTKNVNI